MRDQIPIKTETPNGPSHIDDACTCVNIHAIHKYWSTIDFSIGYGYEPIAIASNVFYLSVG